MNVHNAFVCFFLCDVAVEVDNSYGWLYIQFQDNVMWGAPYHYITLVMSCHGYHVTAITIRHATPCHVMTAVMLRRQSRHATSSQACLTCHVVSCRCAMTADVTWLPSWRDVMAMTWQAWCNDMAWRGTPINITWRDGTNVTWWPWWLWRGGCGRTKRAITKRGMSENVTRHYRRFYFTWPEKVWHDVTAVMRHPWHDGDLTW